jgi:hypothetical protein
MPQYKMSERWENSSEFKTPFDYIIGVGKAADTAAADAAEAEGKQVLQVRRVDMGDLIKLGIAEELDFMSKELVAPTDSAKDDEKATDAIKSAIMKAENYTQMETMVNLVCGAGIMQPKLYQPPMITQTENGKTVSTVNEAARQKGLVYIDHLPWDDRIELFSVIFESEGLSDFREEQETGVGDVEHEPGVSLPANGPVDIRSDDSEGVLL